jgi:hypothetical protein
MAAPQVVVVMIVNSARLDGRVRQRTGRHRSGGLTLALMTSASVALFASGGLSFDFQDNEASLHEIAHPHHTRCCASRHGLGKVTNLARVQRR